MSTTTEYIDLRQAAEILHVSTRTVRRRISDGTIPAYRVGSLIRVRTSDLESVGRRIPNARTA